MFKNLYSKKNSVPKNLLNTISKLLEENNVEISNATKELLREIYKLIGDLLIESMPTNKIKIIEKILKE